MSSATQFMRGFPTEALPPALRNSRCQCKLIGPSATRSTLCYSAAWLHFVADRPQEGGHLACNGCRNQGLAFADIFLGIELRRTRRQRQEGDVFGSFEVFGAVPSGLIENENGVGAGGDFGCAFV